MAFLLLNESFNHIFEFLIQVPLNYSEVHLNSKLMIPEFTIKIIEICTLILRP